MPSVLQFTCPRCGEHRLEEVMSGVTQASSIRQVCEGGDIEYGEQTNEDGQVERYQCMDCGLALQEDEENPIKDCVALWEWLEDNEAKEDEVPMTVRELIGRLLQDSSELQKVLATPRRYIADTLFSEEDFPFTVKDSDGWKVEDSRWCKQVYFDSEDGPDEPSLVATYRVDFLESAIRVTCMEMGIHQRPHLWTSLI